MTTRLLERRSSLTRRIGFALVGLVVIMALVSLVWQPYGIEQIDPANPNAGPSAAHWLGTDPLGRDIFTQIIVGARTTLLVGVVAVGIAGVIGVPLGMLAGSSGPWVNETVMRAMDVVFAFPAVLLAIILAAGFGGSTVTAMVAIGVATVPVFARIARAATLQVMTTDYVLAARSYGRRGLPLMIRYVLPNIASVIIVQASVAFAIAILAEAALSYLGMGTQPPTPTWGRSLQEAQTYLFVNPLLPLWPGLAIALSVLGFNLLGDGLRDSLDPTLRGTE